MQKQAYRVIQQIHHDGILYSPLKYPFEQGVIYAYPHEVTGAVNVGAIVLDPSITVPPEETAPTPKEISNAVPKPLTPLLKPIA